MALRRDHPDDRLDAEIAEHLAQLSAEHERRGLTPEAARIEARRAFGGVQRVQEAHRDARGGRWLADVRADVRYAVRTLVKAPVFAAVSVLTLALGIGANTAIFSIINSMFLRALPVPAPEQLVDVTGLPGRLDALPILASSTSIFEGVGTHEPTQFNLGAGADSEWVDGLWVSAGFFDTMRVPVVVGRGFARDEDRAGGGPAGPVALISHRFWQRRFGGAATVVGRRLTVNRLPVTIVGVTPPGFFGVQPGQSFDVVLPVASRSQFYSEAIFGLGIGNVVGRLRPGVDADAAQAALRRNHARISTALVQAGITDEPLRSAIGVSPLGGRDKPRRVDPYVRPLTILMALVGFVLLIACANLANLLMARATARRAELAVRRALGASRWRLVRQLLTESLVIVVAGAAAGLLFATWASRFLIRLFGAEAAFSTGRIMYGPADLSLDLTMDWRVLLFTGLAAVLTVCLFGTVPAIAGARVTPMHALKDHGQNTPDRRPARFAGGVIAAQVGISLVLLVGAMLLGQTFASVADVDLGFEPARVLAIDAEPPRGPHPEELLEKYQRAMTTIRAVPGVEAVGLSHGGVVGGSRVGVASDALSDIASVRPVSPGWFAAVGAQLLAGRDFTDADRSGAPGVAIVNRAFARRFFGDLSPLGRVVRGTDDVAGSMQAATIVGVVGDMAVSAREGVSPALFAPLSQLDPHSDVLAIALEEGGLTIVVRSAIDRPAALRRPVGDALAVAHPDLGLTFRSMRDELDGLLTRERVLALLSGFFGVLGLGLAAVGLYGVTSYSAGRRRREIGIRLALGARPRLVLRAVLWRSVLLIVSGIAGGTLVSLWLSTFLVAVLFGVEPQDPGTIVLAAMTLLLVGLLAAGIPAWRASRIDPVRVLRAE